MIESINMNRECDNFGDMFADPLNREFVSGLSAVLVNTVSQVVQCHPLTPNTFEWSHVST